MPERSIIDFWSIRGYICSRFIDSQAFNRMTIEKRKTYSAKRHEERFVSFVGQHPAEDRGMEDNRSRMNAR